MQPVGGRAEEEIGISEHGDITGCMTSWQHWLLRSVSLAPPNQSQQSKSPSASSLMQCFPRRMSA
jgi:hypothetical protein